MGRRGGTQWRGVGDRVTRSAQVQAFADALRALKERSGLSYGTLASRLHVSTSTLHRYCAGDAVPAEYATVDRFARTCKASGQEMVELHRRWVLADAERARVPDPELGPSGSLPGGPLPEPTWGGDPPCQEPGKGSKRAPRCGGTEADSAESASDQSGADPPADPADRRPVLVRAGLVAVIVGALVAAAGGIWLATGAPGDDGQSTEAAPLSWTVRPELWASGCEHTYLNDRP